MAKNWSARFQYVLRDIRAREMFVKMREYCRGEVLDVGGWDFFLTACRQKIAFTRWTSLEFDESHVLKLDDERYALVHGDGCNMTFPDASFDTVLNIQVLEHVFEPIKMVHECARVLKPGGYGIFVIPQTAVIHCEPHHYYNFTPFWIRRVMKDAGLAIVEEKPMGGVWSSTASHMFFMMLYTKDRGLKSPTGSPRNLMFYVLYPFMLVYAFLTMLVCLFFSLGDLTEEPNNNLVIVKKPVT